MKVKKAVIGILATLGVICIVAVCIAFPLMWLWNWLMPALFGLIKINFWQALGVSLLTGVLFKTNNINYKK